MTHDDLPSFFHAADRTSQDGQARYLWVTRAQLAALLAAASAGVASQFLGDQLGWLSAAAFIAAAFLRLHAEGSREDRMWYEGRAAAESAKTLAWRYAVGGRPFRVADDAGEVRSAFVSQLKAVAEAVTHLPIAPSTDSGDEITEGMETLRSESLPTRSHAYRADRIEEQRRWYARESERSLSAHRKWRVALFGIELLGAVCAIIVAAGAIDVDALGVASAAATAILAWLGVKQYWNLATAYSIAAHELAQIAALSTARLTEDEWSKFVDEAEEAISREHTLWVASRGLILPWRQR